MTPNFRPSNTMKSALVIGTQSFVDGGCKVGSQFLAESLAMDGWQVDYVATASSLFDVWGRKRHARLKRVWVNRQGAQGVSVRPGLTEWAFKAPFPAIKLLLRWRWQLRAYSWFVPKRFRQRVYDACITEVTPNMLYLPWVQAKSKILRLNDWPPGFAHDLHPIVIAHMESGLINASFDDVWAVSRPLAAYASRLNGQNSVVFLPNGVEEAILNPTTTIIKKPDSAVYVGGVGAWFDLELLKQTARLLPHWQFDVYGTGSQTLSDLPPNVRGHGSVARSKVPDLLAQYEVGLIPFANTDNRMAFVERPLKFYEYIAAGLGVASTDFGALRSGMAELAAYGNSATAFAQAIVQARQQASQRAPEFGRAFVQQHGWTPVLQLAQQRLCAVMQGTPLPAP